ncbi:MAG: MotA/TolQ/ExbB proton channel family protein [Myxococcales bacterium]|nr:MotA/TolQ/ExbB proton channel family protein [Myxococcales bacterium]
MNDTLGAILLTVSSALLAPVMIALLALTAWATLQLGGLLAEAIDRRRRARYWRPLITELLADPTRRLAPQDLTLAPRDPLARTLTAARPATAPKHLDDTQLTLERALAHLHLGLRLGPMLGLAGTLIPLGPALLALSAGDTDTLAHKLVVAFSTTVVGLLAGALCLIAHNTRQRWYTRDLSDLGFLLDRLPDESPP